MARDDTAAARALAQDVRRGEGFAIWRVAVFLTAFTPDPATMREVIQELIKGYPNAGLRADLHWFAFILDLGAGRVDAARTALADAVDAERSEAAQKRRSGFESVTEWFAATLPLPYADSTLLLVRRRAASPAPPASKSAFVNELGIGGPIQLEPLRQYTLGTLSLRLRDTASAAAAATHLQRLAALGDATALTRDLDRGLRARLAWQRERPQEALVLLETLESRDSQGDINVIPFVVRANERFLRGEVLASLGRDAEALRWFASLGKGSVSEIPMLALSHLRQAEIHERLGNRNLAANHSARFFELWRDVEPEFQPFVDAARRRLSSLARSK